MSSYVKRIDLAPKYLNFTVPFREKKWLFCKCKNNLKKK